ncbi:protealysin inhibitor emfourin [Streptomyces sp. NPDC053431]|uniref:protealysin inhibitor emfourin n=1 Tax=Streptomyces sp. NPDC053431 TaxID=3365703 RepID=UPI0037D81D6E
MRIRVRRTGGFAGIERSAEVDTAGLADAAELQTLATAVMSEPQDDDDTEAARGVPDGFLYEITVDGRTLRTGDPDLTEAQRALIQRVLKEGA